jgi:hypothetical protein
MFLEQTANQLTDAYLARALDDPTAVPVALRRKVLAEIVLSCVFGVDTDPVAVELSRLSLSLLTGGELSPSDLARHVTVGNVLEGPDHLPPAYVDAGGGPVLPPKGDPYDHRPLHR